MSAIADLDSEVVRSALQAALAFAEAEVENREATGGLMSDYVNEAQEVADRVRGALATLGVTA